LTVAGFLAGALGAADFQSSHLLIAHAKRLIETLTINASELNEGNAGARQRQHQTRESWFNPSRTYHHQGWIS
jgi:hypothetical protein